MRSMLAGVAETGSETAQRLEGFASVRSTLAGVAETGSAPPQAVRDCFFYNPSTTSWSPSPYTGEAHLAFSSGRRWQPQADG